MNLLIAQSGLGMLEISQGDWMSRRLPYEVQSPCCPCSNQTLLAFGCAQNRECLCVTKHEHELVSRMPAVPGLCSMCLSPCGRYIYQLSSEADCIHTRLTANGELLYAAPAGVFPRTLRLQQNGEMLLAAGGAEPEAYVFTAPELKCERVIHTRHPCFAADNWQGGMVLVCAVEGHDIQTMVYTLRPHACRPCRLLELSGPPGGMCVCPDGRHMLLSTPDGLMKIALETGKILWNRTEWPLCMQVCCCGAWALVSDTLDGKTWLMHHQKPWERRIVAEGACTQACFA